VCENRKRNSRSLHGTPHGKPGRSGTGRLRSDDKGKARFSGKVVADDKAFFKSNLDRFEVKIAEDVSP
jgi:hypothetical protein